ncbi:MAG TPA: hypothetical protein VF752_13070 [Thermoleophilaceae bacterium]
MILNVDENLEDGLMAQAVPPTQFDVLKIRLCNTTANPIVASARSYSYVVVR